jgi:2,3-dihydroxybenzoate-AMP ligase
MDGVVGWPEDFAREYREKGYWKNQAIADAFVDSVERHRARIAVIDADRRLTYGELGAMVERLAGHLVERGITNGAPVLFQLPNTAEFVVAYFACLAVGAVPICSLPHHRHTEIAQLAKLSDARAWFGPSTMRNFDYLAMIAELAPGLPSLKEIWTLGEATGPATASITALLAKSSNVDPAAVKQARPRGSDVAVLQLSGGTTGIPKLIPRTNDDYHYNAMAFAEVASLGRDDVLLVPIPAAHNFPLACPGLQGALLLGARVVLASSPAPDAVFPLIERERATWIPAVPATLIQWTQHETREKFDLSSLKRIYIGGQRLNPEAALAATRAFGNVVRQCYGMAEGLLCCTRDEDPPEVHLESQGRPMSPDDELRVVDDEGRPVAAGELGELETRGPYTIRGYFRAAEHNKTAFTADGFYRTGDMVRILPGGYVSVEGRKKDLINRGGEKISAEEVENLILAHDAVKNAALVAMPDPILGERACACVELHQGQTLALDALIAFMRAKNIASFKLPERLEVFEKLPLTGVGKVSKKDLRAIVATRVGGDAKRS